MPHQREIPLEDSGSLVISVVTYGHIASECRGPKNTGPRANYRQH